MDRSIILTGSNTCRATIRFGFNQVILAGYFDPIIRQQHCRDFYAYLEYGHPLQEPYARDYAVRNYKTVLKTVHCAKPSSVNLALAAVDHFYRFLELPPPEVKREDLPSQAPRALEPPEQKRFLYTFGVR